MHGNVVEWVLDCYHESYADAPNDTLGLARYPKGILKQVKTYRRGDRVYLPHSGGFIEVRAKQPDGSFITAHPDVKLLEHDKNSSFRTEKYLGQDCMRWRR